MSVSMSCHIEVKIDGEWHHWSSPQVYDIRIFGLLGCERYAEKADPITPLKLGNGMEGEFSKPTRSAWDHEMADSIGCSWLNSEECAELYRRVIDLELDPDRVFGYIFNNDLRMIEYPDEMPCEDYRMIYWFLC